MAVHGRTPTEFFDAPAGTQKAVGVLQMMHAIYPQQLNIARDTSTIRLIAGETRILRG
jgi:hypothetical protein